MTGAARGSREPKTWAPIRARSRSQTVPDARLSGLTLVPGGMRLRSSPEHLARTLYAGLKADPSASPARSHGVFRQDNDCLSVRSPRGPDGARPRTHGILVVANRRVLTRNLDHGDRA